MGCPQGVKKIIRYNLHIMIDKPPKTPEEIEQGGWTHASHPPMVQTGVNAPDPLKTRVESVPISPWDMHHGQLTENTKEDSVEKALDNMKEVFKKIMNVLLKK
jgi:hypothetical protein